MIDPSFRVVELPNRHMVLPELPNPKRSNRSPGKETYAQEGSPTWGGIPVGKYFVATTAIFYSHWAIFTLIITHFSD
jgi:hypothetical protein